MSLSPEVQAQADEIRRNKSLVKSLQGERDLWKSKAMDAQGKLDELANKDRMSDEDREELKRQAAELDALNDELEGAAQENTKPESGASAGQPAPGGPGFVEATPPEHNPDAPRPDPIAGTGQNGTVPLMPNLAFDPAGSGSVPATTDGGQPQQAPAIETAGGFVVAGGGSTVRAPGSRPESPSSSLIIPEDPNAKGPASTADEVKSGLGDSSQNALKGNDGKPVQDGPGMPKEPTDADREAAQKQQDALNAEKERREANPLNLSEEDLAKRNANNKPVEGNPAAGPAS